MSKLPKVSFYFLGAVLIIFFVYFSSLNNIFYWDTVQLASKHANFYFETNFSQLILPDQIDSGHIPAFGFVLALCWKLFGRTLLVSHLMLLPFLIGIIWQGSRLIKLFFEKKDQGIVFALVFLEPTLLAQITLVSPDIWLIFFFLLGLNTIIHNKRLLLSAAVVGLFLTSMRGMMVAFSLLLIDLFVNLQTEHKLKFLIKRSMLYLPALLIFILFNIYHFNQKGWIAFHSNSPWAASFEMTTLNGLLYNFGILLWRLIDFGRVIIWVIALPLIILNWKRLSKLKNVQLLAFIFFIPLFIISINILWAQGLMGHRYLLPAYISFALLSAYLVSHNTLSNLKKRVLQMIWISCLLTGHMWVYPDRIAQGWDSSLAYLPYLELREKAKAYLEYESIEADKVSSFFPNYARFDDLELNGDNRRFESFQSKKQYVFYSNTYNVSDSDLHKLQTKYKPMKTFSKGKVYIKIYELKK